ncbi:MAG: helix-turn-helix domain-containing protein [Chloroflexota bacterium]|jgi:DNA-binding HxlR family transcriptional regulator|nr:helix-turn-helix transcriptional regulator [Dehalococcoidia bacterium]MDW8046964.1 helix-turn-helix domain-containing protein [Chloroflexota bacterium]
MARSRFEAMECSVARTLAVIGDAWTLLIIRDAFRGVTRFDDFQANLGIARNVLSHRLRLLVREGILERRPYSQHPPRFEYRLTAKGRDLYPIILSLLRWGDRWAAGPEGPPLLLTHLVCGQTTQGVLTCEHCGTPLDPRDVRPVAARPPVRAG